MNEPINLYPERLTKENFAPFGGVIELTNSEDIKNGSIPPIFINQGFATKHPKLAVVDSMENEGVTGVHIFQSKVRDYPLRIELLEKHPYSSQLFFPQTTKPFLLVVTPPGNTPDLEKIKVFITDGYQGVNYHRAVWHHPLLSLENNALFLVVDRVDGKEDKTVEELEEFSIKEKVLIHLPN